MQFTSLTYMIFLALAVTGYFAIPSNWGRRLWLLAASYGFYALAATQWLFVLVGITLYTYFIGRCIGGANGKPERKSVQPKILLFLGIALPVATLLFFKYANFAANIMGYSSVKWGITSLASMSEPLLKIILPLGISFYTFQVIAYMVDVYRGTASVERNLLTYAVFTGFFPQISAGPIPRAHELLPQIKTSHHFTHENMQSALLLILWGFFKKLIIADRIAVLVNTVYGNVHSYSGPTTGLIFFVATILFAIQLYADFSAYTDIARGSARLFGIELKPNFAAPYLSRSVKEFWQRWHMTLMSWLKDYIYIPLGGSRVSKFRHNLNILLVFLVSGIWHGAGLSFVVWGLLNGGFQVVGGLTQKAREKVASLVRLDKAKWLHAGIKVVCTFLLISFAWIFFRANSLRDALYVVRHVLDPRLWHIQGFVPESLGLSYPELIVAILGMLILFLADILSKRIDPLAWLNKRNVLFRWSLYLGAIAIVVMFGYYGTRMDSPDFMYFQF